MKKQELYPIGQGGGCNRDKKTDLITITYIYRNVLNMEIGRELMVGGIDKLLHLINSDPKNEKYFAEFPAKVGLVHISIIGQTPEIKSHESIDVASNIENYILYKVENTLPYDRPYRTISKETFAEAQYILAHPDEVRRREVTTIERDEEGNITELKGRWGMVVKEVALYQIESGRFEYYIIEDGIEKQVPGLN